MSGRDPRLASAMLETDDTAKRAEWLRVLADNAHDPEHPELGQFLEWAARRLEALEGAPSRDELIGELRKILIDTEEDHTSGALAALIGRIKGKNT